MQDTSTSIEFYQHAASANKFESFEIYDADATCYKNEQPSFAN